MVYLVYLVMYNVMVILPYGVSGVSCDASVMVIFPYGVSYGV